MSWRVGVSSIMDPVALVALGPIGQASDQAGYGTNCVTKHRFCDRLPKVRGREPCNNFSMCVRNCGPSALVTCILRINYELGLIN